MLSSRPVSILGRLISTRNPADTFALMTDSILTSGSLNPSNPASQPVLGFVVYPRSPRIIPHFRGFGGSDPIGRDLRDKVERASVPGLFLRLLKTGGRAAVMAIEEYERLKVFEVGHVDSGPSTSGTNE
jgi:hypothetical protein